MKIFKPVAIGVGAFIYSLLSLQAALGDDTEIYVPKDLPADQQVPPNILFVLDSSGSMGSQVPNTGGKTRNQVMKEVVNNLIDELKAKENVRVGFMRFDGNDGGYVISPLQRLTNTNASAVKTVVNAIPASGNTPLLETYYESYLYMTGSNRKWGDKSVSASRSGEKYITPVEHSCQKSHIIYLTDGAPTQDTASNAAVRTLVNGKNISYPSSTCGNGNGACLPHLAEYMSSQDLYPAPTPFSDPTNREQTVTSHFVGFTVDLPLLKNAADAGGGKYYTSDNVSGLTDALKEIVVDITAENTTFAAPSVAVSAFNNLGYRNDLYYALFRPAEGARWPGNVKRYKLTKDSSGNPLIVDKNGNAAIDSSTGFFRDNASSFWSSVDGQDVSKGGVAGRLLDPDSRKLLTWTAADRTPTASNGVTDSAALDATAHRVLDSNGAVTQGMLGATNSTERSSFINWARGKNANGTARLAVGDVLHNEPRLVAYTTDEDLVRVSNSQKPQSDPDYQASPEQLYMFFGSNEGFIHAIDPTNGAEKFAFIPKELLGNPGAYLKDAKGSGTKKYGMDGQINLWTEYGSLNTTNKTRSISKAYLYAGMRRGGSNYYALDVTNIDAPRLKWVIKGPAQTKLANGSYVNATTGFTPGYEKLGQTFSTPKLAKIKLNGVSTKVLVFTGGYDLDQDNVGTNAPKNDDIGNGLFIADADTGKLIWRAGNVGDTTANLQVANMTNSMPADPTIVDVDGDGLVDIIYASDLRGQVFRFDFNSANTGANAIGADAFATGGRIASLAGTTAADNRRFFTAPDVALLRERGGKTYFTISLGSGFRESPLNEDTNDRFYVLRDFNVITRPGSYTSIVEGDLVDVSSVNLTDAQATQILSDIAALEAQMAALNQGLKDAQDNFTAYKAGIGHTAKQNAAIQAYSDANARQKQIDSILANDPYLAEHAPNTRQQSILQDSVTRAHDVLAAVEQARAEAQATADSTDAVALTTAADDAETALSDATTAYNAAQTTADTDAATAAQAQQDKQAADQALADQDTLIQGKEADRDQKKADWVAAGSPGSGTEFDAYNQAEADLLQAQNDRAPLQQTADSANQNYLTAQSTADSSAADAASKQAIRDSATTARDDAVLARDNALRDDSAAANLATQRDRMALEYEKLINLQYAVDSAYGQVLSKEDQIIAAKADPSYPSDQIPALEAELTTLRQNYADSSYVNKRTELNSATPPQVVVRLDEVNDALASGDATAIAAALQTALDALESSIGLAGSPTLSTSELLAREEASKRDALLQTANNEASTLAVIDALAAERDGFTSTGKGYQDEADTLAAKAYDHDSGLLSDAQYAEAQLLAAPDLLAYFDAYQFLIDKALAKASDPDTGLPALRIKINEKYAQLTPGNSYTPNMALLDASKGFYLRLPKGEKVLSTSISFRGTVLFSSFSPRGQAVSACGSDVGRGRTYALSLRDASAVFTETVSGTKTPVRSFDLQRSGIPASPAVLIGGDGAPTIVTGTEVLDPDCVDGVELCRAGDAVKATYWREN
ncbi:PilC/PilY family type IV pilus protein [Pseudomonas sp. MBLB4123]|uniref:PilC/PilY family type IV pilus protein n=1 Tax=Pseudomonas sp. MBLB4123 TaxID=3451557 RepID=UPI003F74F293